MEQWETRILEVDPRHPDPAAIEAAVQVIRHGRPVAFPTDTVYGLGCDGLNAAAPPRIFAIKGRPSWRPLILLVSGLEQALSVTKDVPAVARDLAERYWPGPLTLVLEKSPIVPATVTSGGSTVGVRCPASEVALALIRAAGVPLATTSANLSGRPSSTNATMVAEALGGKVPIILDAGESPLGHASTVLDLTVSPAVVVREGAVPVSELKALLGGGLGESE